MNLLKTYTVIKFHFNKNGSDLLAKIPSIIYRNGDQEYYKNGQRHRPSCEGPAVIRPAKPDCNGVACVNGYQAYYENGRCHRPSLEGPAVIHVNGNRIYYENGQRHRPSLEGPAVICPAKPDCNGAVTGVNDYQAYYKNGKLHRPFIEGPAVIRPTKPDYNGVGVNGYQMYYENGKLLKPFIEGSKGDPRLNVATSLPVQIVIKNKKYHENTQLIQLK